MEVYVKLRSHERSQNLTNLRCGLGDKLLIQLEHRKLGRVEDLVTELSVPLHTQDLQIDVAS